MTTPRDWDKELAEIDKLMSKQPAQVPALAGVKLRISDVLCAGARETPDGTLLASKPAPEMLTPAMVT